MEFVFVVVSGFVLAIAAPALQAWVGRWTNWLLALLPLVIAGYLASTIPPIADGRVIRVEYPWVPSLGVNLSFYIDGLSLLFSLLITVVGVLVLIYAGSYLSGHPHLGRFNAYILAFMGSMLGLVLSDNLITLFVFWELTSLTSYLLIGFDHERPGSRYAALQALLVTAMGGLALLAGALLLGQVGNSLELSVLLGQGEAIRAHELYLPILALLLLAAFTKSAQFPFHFWLPGAMEAPTPVSAYLHSATMVKAGVYLMARLSVGLGGTDAWLYVVGGAGAVTMLVGAVVALQQMDLKLVLAYSTVSALGLLTMLLGLGTLLAVQAAMVVLLGHALYKGALFLVAGAVDHEAGTREVHRLGGLRTAMPITAAAGILAALSMAGLPPFFGFVGKELFLEAVLEPEFALLLAVVLVASMFLVAAAAIAGVAPFVGRRVETPKHAHEAPFGLWLGPSLLATTGLLVSLFPDLVARGIVSPSVSAILGVPATADLALWHGFTMVLALSALALAGGVILFIARANARRLLERLLFFSSWGPERWYAVGLEGLNWVARTQTRLLQNGYLRNYLLTIVFTILAFVGFTWFVRAPSTLSPLRLDDVRLHEAVLVVVILLAALVAARTRSRLSAVVALGVVGYSVALIYILFGAPDLAMTQVFIETLTVILFVLAFYHLPGLARRSTRGTSVRDVVVSVAVGVVMGGLVLVATGIQADPSVAQFFVEQSVPGGEGHNIVNTILVDFRALDTLGEITVLALAGIGVYALLKLRPKRSETG